MGQFPKEAVLFVDLQNDFMDESYGVLSVIGFNDQWVEDVIEVIMRRCYVKMTPMVFSLDMHPPGHESFNRWPKHCVMGTPGAELCWGVNDLLQTPPVYGRGCPVVTVKKGMNKDIDSYSAFYDNERKHSTNLDNFLKEQGVETLYICGVAGDFCVDYTVRDAVEAGFKVVVIKDGVKYVDPAKEEKLLNNWQEHGVNIISLDEFDPNKNAQS